MAAAEVGRSRLSRTHGKSHHPSLINDLNVLMPADMIKLVFTMMTLTVASDVTSWFCLFYLPLLKI